MAVQVPPELESEALMQRSVMDQPTGWQRLARLLFGGSPDERLAGMFGFGALRGPQINVPPALAKALGGRFGKLRRGAQQMKSAKALQGRNPAGRADVPSWEAMASTEAPGGRNLWGEIE